MSDRNNYDYNCKLMQLREVENNLNDLLSDLQSSSDCSSISRNKNKKVLIEKSFNALKYATLDMYDCLPSSEDSNEGTSGSSGNRPGRLSLEPEVSNSQETPNGLRPEPDVRGEGPSHSDDSRSDAVSVISDEGPEESVLRSFESTRLGEEDADGDVSATGPTSILTDEAGQEESVTETTFFIKVTSVLRRVCNKVMGFFQWLKTKLTELATKAWDKVCEAFRCTFNFFRNLFQRVIGRTQSAKPHMA